MNAEMDGWKCGGWMDDRRIHGWSGVQMGGLIALLRTKVDS